MGSLWAIQLLDLSARVASRATLAGPRKLAGKKAQLQSNPPLSRAYIFVRVPILGVVSALRAREHREHDHAPAQAHVRRVPHHFPLQIQLIPLMFLRVGRESTRETAYVRGVAPFDPVDPPTSRLPNQHKQRVPQNMLRRCSTGSCGCGYGRVRLGIG